jgi:murein DD-endopeptidase MepM/ murein hydrolase activator NlpD
MRKEYVWPLPQPLQISCSFTCHKTRKPVSATPGTDYPKKVGTKIKSISSGVVYYVNSVGQGTAGKNVTIKHGTGHYSYYFHMNSIDVKVGERVHAGDVLGTVGSTGASTGPHLHLAIRHIGVLVDPHKFLASRVK